MAFRSSGMFLQQAVVSTPRIINLGSLTFQQMRTKNKVYVDKTSEIADFLANEELSCRTFFARPRRFGKSLSLGVMGDILAAGDLPKGVTPWPGYRPVDIPSIFGGLAVYDRFQRNDPSLGSLMRRPHFVVKLPLGSAPTGTRLEKVIIEKLANVAGRAFGEKIKSEVGSSSTPETALGVLVDSVPQQVPIAVLVDEYDATIIKDVTAKRWDAADNGIEALRSLLTATKADDVSNRIERFVVTGVARFAPSSLFSGANNFRDLTEDPITSRIFGFTDKEIRRTFPMELSRLGKHRQEAAKSEGDGNSDEDDSRAADVAMEELHFWYNGYCFDGQTSVFNPTGVLSALDAGKVTGTEMEGASSFSWLGMTPMVILEQLGKLDSVIITKGSFDIADLSSHRVDAVAMLQQTGLLTYVPGENGLTSVPVTSSTSPKNIHRLRPPNEYARNTFVRLLEKFVDASINLPQISQELQRALITRNPNSFDTLICRALASVAGNTKRGSDQEKQREAPLHAFVHGLLMASMSETLGTLDTEHSSSSGRADLVLRLNSIQNQPPAVWILELGVVPKDRTAKVVFPPKHTQVKSYFQKHSAFPGIAAVVEKKVLDLDHFSHFGAPKFDRLAKIIQIKYFLFY